MASNSYTPPGVTVTEFTDPSVSPLFATPTQIALVGMTAGVITKTDTITLDGTTEIELPGVTSTDEMASDAILSVTNALDPSDSEPDGYPEGEGGYVFDNDAHTIRVGNSSPVIDNDATVYVTYEYVPADYFQPVRYDNINDVINRFGSALTDDGTTVTINSVLTYAAALAFENGAQDVVLQALFHDNSGSFEQPNDSQAASDATWASAYTNLRGYPDINVIVPVVGQSAANVGDAQMLAIQQATLAHLDYMRRGEQQYIMAVFGEDSSESSAVAQAATIRTHAQTLASAYGDAYAEQSIFVSPTRFTRSVPTATAGNILVGGQYCAAAIAGMLASRPVSSSLTRKLVSGFTSVAEVRTKADKNADAAAGLLVVENKQGGATQIRHGVTINTAATAKREISIVRAKHRVIESVRDTIETQIIGTVVADGDAPFIVQTAVIGVLEGLRAQRDIVGYSDVQARTLNLDPTTVEVRFNYRPAFPVNYVQIGFSLDLTSGETTLSDTVGADTATF